VVQPLPHAGALPIAQPPPAGDRATTAQPRRRHQPLPRPWPLRQLHWHRPGRGLQRRSAPPSAEPGWQPPAQYRLHLIAVCQIRDPSPGQCCYRRNLPRPRPPRRPAEAWNGTCQRRLQPPAHRSPSPNPGLL